MNNSGTNSKPRNFFLKHLKNKYLSKPIKRKKNLKDLNDI